MSNILIHTADEPALLSAKALRSLVERGDGDAALLYLALLRHQGTLTPQALTKEMRWDPARMVVAERILRELGLVSPELETPEQDLEPEPVDYRQDELAFQLEDNAEFRQLTAEVECRLGKKLSPADLSILLGLLNSLGLPSDVIYTLVGHCVERQEARYGLGRRPTMKQIERAAYNWANRGIDTQAAAAEYLKRYARRDCDYADYMKVLNLGDRFPVKSEESFLSEWVEMGFGAEAVALAYEKTVLNCHELKWAYCNRILERWHKAGLHTPEEIEKGDRPKKRKASKAVKTDENEVRKYAQQLQKRRERKKSGQTEPDA